MSISYLRNKIVLEILWWIFTALICLLLFLPFYIYEIDFPYFNYNIFFVIASITITRWIFQLKHSFIAHQLILKFILMFASVVILLQAYKGVNLLNLHNAEYGYYFLFEHLELNVRYRLADYVNWQFFFFGIATIAASIVLPFRLLVSIFRVYNMGKE